MQYRYKLQLLIIPIVISIMLIITSIFVYQTSSGIKTLQHDIMELKLGVVVDKCKSELSILDRVGISTVKFYLINSQNKVISFIKDIKIPGGYIYIINSQGKIIYHPDLNKKDEDKYFNNIDFINTIINDKKGEVTYNKTIYGKDDDKFFAIFSYFEKWDWIIVAAAKAKSINKAVRAASTQTVFISFVLLIITVLLLFYVSKTITTPIKILRDKAQEVSKGSLNTQFDIKGSEEFKSLSESFNKMVNNLKSDFNKIEEQTKEIENYNKELESMDIRHLLMKR